MSNFGLYKKSRNWIKELKKYQIITQNLKTLFDLQIEPKPASPASLIFWGNKWEEQKQLSKFENCHQLFDDDGKPKLLPLIKDKRYSHYLCIATLLLFWWSLFMRLLVFEIFAVLWKLYFYDFLANHAVWNVEKYEWTGLQKTHIKKISIYFLNFTFF